MENGMLKVLYKKYLIKIYVDTYIKFVTKKGKLNQNMYF